MPVIKRALFLLLFLAICTRYTTADEACSITKVARFRNNLYRKPITENPQNLSFYAGINPFALISFLSGGMGSVGTIMGVASGQEFGISLYGGMQFEKAHSVEMRFSTGPADIVVWDTQLQLGYIWYPLQQFINWDAGLSVGLMVRQFFWNNQITKEVVFNLTPELLVGWRFTARSLVFDLRAGWNAASITWTTIPHVKPAAGWTMFPYNLTFTFGVAWRFGAGR